jgi:hypothetical protein
MLKYYSSIHTAEKVERRTIKPNNASLEHENHDNVCLLLCSNMYLRPLIINVCIQQEIDAKGTVVEKVSEIEKKVCLFRAKFSLQNFHYNILLKICLPAAALFEEKFQNIRSVFI